MCLFFHSTERNEGWVVDAAAHVFPTIGLICAHDHAFGPQEKDPSSCGDVFTHTSKIITHRLFLAADLFALSLIDQPRGIFFRRKNGGRGV